MWQWHSGPSGITTTSTYWHLTRRRRRWNSEDRVIQCSSQALMVFPESDRVSLAYVSLDWSLSEFYHLKCSRCRINEWDFCADVCAVFWRCQLAPFPENRTMQLWKSLNGTDVSSGPLVVKAVDRLLTSSSATLHVNTAMPYSGMIRIKMSNWKFLDENCCAEDWILRCSDILEIWEELGLFYFCLEAWFLFSSPFPGLSSSATSSGRQCGSLSLF